MVSYETKLRIQNFIGSFIIYILAFTALYFFNPTVISDIFLYVRGSIVFSLILASLFTYESGNNVWIYTKNILRNSLEIFSVIFCGTIFLISLISLITWEPLYLQTVGLVFRFILIVSYLFSLFSADKQE